MTTVWAKNFHDVPRLIELGGDALCVRIRGKGPTVVLEAAGSGQGVGGAWGPVVEERLAEVATVVTYDRRGVGRSAGTPRRTITAMADDLHELLRALEIEPAIVVSWSYGSLVSAVHAVRHPGDVAGLVFVDPTPTTPPPTPQAVRVPLQHLAVAQLRVMGWASAHGFFDTRPGMRMSARLAGPEATNEMIEQTTGFYRTPQAIRELADTLSRMDSHLTEVAGILGGSDAHFPPVPTTVISAGRRPERMPDAHRAHVDGSHSLLAALAPGGRVVVAEHATHQVPYEDPDTVVRHVIESMTGSP
ncbi:alpha/beta fold hydrolase [Actinoalloteichus sp. GBA129-24]|uniref:alpha/beta fold hydrolase n=1 Tax=Actinoalloteichus sp. GBA129-24 TaxID=1612551 RepID=UPI000950B6EC|nr:alpha/beta hydrolase [Actinoalloteichus sp. GBA129-24]APU19089.1 putative hydrolase or acyltransferase of alpha/beta superfamily [Actinoalloteichus sp. GBA129-24]